MQQEPIEYIITARSMLKKARGMTSNEKAESLKLSLKALESAAYAVLISRGILIRDGVDLVDVLESLNMHSLGNEIRRYRELLLQCLNSDCGHESIMHEFENIENIINSALSMVVHNVPHLGP